MKVTYSKASLLAMIVGVVLLSTSCEVYPDEYTRVTNYVGDGYESKSAWTAASYDAAGFPIYGYAYGRPVYGYTQIGRPVYAVNQLYSGCYVPDWRPASWCRNAHHYPQGCNKAPKPPKFDHGHKPHVRPDAHAPIHKHPDKVLGKPRPGKVSRPDAERPGTSASRPGKVTRPDAERPGTSAHRPGKVATKKG